MLSRMRIYGEIFREEGERVGYGIPMGQQYKCTVDANQVDWSSGYMVSRAAIGEL